MKIPIFEEVLLKGTSLSELHSVVEDSKIGKVPCYLNLSNFKSDEVETLVINLEQVILEAALHPRFPYPLFLVTEKSVKSLFPCVKSVKELPEHYFKKVKRPNNKELQLLNKLSLKVDKIKNLQLYKVTQDLKDTADTQKKLYVETKELHFLERLNHVLFETKKTKSKER